MSEVITIDELTVPVQRPADVAALGELVRSAPAVYPIGGGTRLSVGWSPKRPGVAIDLRSLDQVVDYPARDLTITVQAGMTVARLQAILASEKQRLPVEVPAPEQATLGGSIASNISGPRRYGAGTFRDYLIGISTVGPEGVETKAGGRVVKNVAGYDLCKLHTGALGTLGIITQVTLKVRPLPELQALVTLGCDDCRLGTLLETLHNSRTRPIALELLDTHAAQALGMELHPWTVIVGFEDNEAAVEWQVQQVMAELKAIGFVGIKVLASEAAEPLWRGLREGLRDPQASLTFKATIRPGQVSPFVQAIRQPALRLHVQVGDGIVRGHLASGVPQAEAIALINRVAEQAVPAGGELVIEQAPAAWKPCLPVWGRTSGQWGLMQRVKAALDPQDKFNPGRMFLSRG
ncbi:MAG: FAD-binding oxidoreductase [Gemmataceae bacterium]